MYADRAEKAIQNSVNPAVQRRRPEKVIKAARARLQMVTASPERTIAEAMKQLDEAGTGALILCTEQGDFVGLLTDGDLRRSFLRGVQFSQRCGDSATKTPITVGMQHNPADIFDLMNRLDINHVPLLDNAGRVLGLVIRQDFELLAPLNMSAVIMAGGLGTRLMPLTRDVPKPMLPVGDRPLMEVTIERLRKAGIERVNVTTHHLSERITEHFGDGSEFGVHLKYVTEEHPLGTAGGLQFIRGSKEPMLVLNGDVLTAVNYRDLLTFHRESRADLTVGVRLHEVHVPYGVVECQGSEIKELREKPTLRLLLNAGVYILEPAVSYFIPKDRRFDMTDLIKTLIDAGRKVVSFPIVEYWMDIGQHADYEKANEDVRMGRI